MTNVTEQLKTTVKGLQCRVHFGSTDSKTGVTYTWRWSLCPRITPKCVKQSVFFKVNLTSCGKSMLIN